MVPSFRFCLVSLLFLFAATFCPTLPGISNGTISLVGDMGGLSVVGTNATYYCDRGYYLQSDATRSCMGDGLSVNGTWSGMEPACIGMKGRAFNFLHSQYCTLLPMR